MAFSLNRAQIIGNVTREAEVRVAGASKVATFGVATNFSWMDKATGQRKDKAEFHNVVAWGKLAEICQTYLKKGTKVYVEGRMQTRDWEGEDGVKRYKTEIVAENVIMLDRKGDGAGSGMGGGMGAGSSASAGDDMEDMSAPAFQPARGQRSVKESASVKEEEVKIDDLPF